MEKKTYGKRISFTELAQVTIFTQPSEKAFFARVHTILAYNLGK